MRYTSWFLELGIDWKIESKIEEWDFKLRCLSHLLTTFGFYGRLLRFCLWWECWIVNVWVDKQSTGFYLFPYGCSTSPGNQIIKCNLKRIVYEVYLRGDGNPVFSRVNPFLPVNIFSLTDGVWYLAEAELFYSPRSPHWLKLLFYLEHVKLHIRVGQSASLRFTKFRSYEHL